MFFLNYPLNPAASSIKIQSIVAPDLTRKSSNRDDFIFSVKIIKNDGSQIIFTCKEFKRFLK